VVSLLLAGGAHIEAVDMYGQTPLHGAARGHLEVVSLLLAGGAQIEAVDLDGRTPLMMAQLLGQMEVVTVMERARRAVPACVALYPPTSPRPAASLPLKTDVFLTHDWGVDRANHRRVSEINNALKAKGLTTWFDEERMEGDVREKMREGIDNCKCVVVFITKRYLEKVGGNNAGDNCQLEFKYAAFERTNNNMVPVVMEPEVRDTKTWTGPVRFELNRKLYVDCGEPIVSEAKLNELYSRISSIIGRST